MVEEIRQNTRNTDRYRIRVEEFIGDLQAEGLAHGTIANYVKGVRALFKANRIDISFPRLRRRVIYHDRSPNSKELTTLLDVGDLRDKVIISLFALGGFRVGTLVKLQYRHVKKDLEAGIVTPAVGIENLQASPLEKLLQVLDAESLARASTAKYKQMVGDACLLIPQETVDN